MTTAPTPYEGRGYYQRAQQLRPGEVVWADLYTPNARKAARFYGPLFGWTASYRNRNGHAYILMSNDGRPLAGIVQRPGMDRDNEARWIPYIDVPNAATAVSAVTRDGGRIIAPVARFAGGIHAIVADNEGDVVGIRQSAVGAPEHAPVPGDWAWAELFAPHPRAVGQFYARVFDYQVEPDPEARSGGHFILTSDGDAWGGIQEIPAGAFYRRHLWLGFVQVGDLSATIAHVADLGGSVLNDVAPAPRRSRWAVISDPDGGMIGLIQFVPGTSPAKLYPPGDRTYGGRY